VTPPPSTRKTNPLRARKHWWLDPGFLFVLFLYIGSGVAFIWWISYLEQTVAAIVLAILWVLVLPVVVLLAKRMIYDTHWVDHRVVQKTKQDIIDHRIKVRKEFIQTELDVLLRGERSPVLDIWRLSAQLAGRHPFFNDIETIWIDPSLRELQIRIQMSEVPPAPADTKKLNPFFIETAHFLKIAAIDPYLGLLKRFFNTIVLVLYSLRENEQHIDVPFPFFSIIIPPEHLGKLSTVPLAAFKDLSPIGEVRFRNGAEIEPHREIEGRRAHGK
jgi:membrane protein implicated in regulation of membrane protease activity